jgi:hypothetical protein
MVCAELVGAVLALGGTDMPEESRKAEDLIVTGAEIAGGAIGGALGFLAGGPASAAGAGALGVIIAKGTSKLLLDFANRHLSIREEVRIGAAASFALAEIQRRLDEGQQPRNDGFFADNASSRTSADELFEGVLQKSKNEHEEKKIRMLGSFFASIAFDPSVSVGEANHLLRVVENLTYRQLCVLAILSAKSRLPGTRFRTTYYSSIEGSLTNDNVSLLQEVFDMYTYGLLAQHNEERTDHIILNHWNNLAPDLLQLTSSGERLTALLGLEVGVPGKDLQDIVSCFVK